MDGIFDQFAKFERAKTAERTRRGKLRKAREGKIIASMKPPYGFRYGEGHDSLTVHEPEMLVVQKIFRVAADGLGTSAIQGGLYRESIPAPMGGRNWQRTVIKRLVLNDIYKPHTYEETAELVSAEVATPLDPTKEYGIRWWNRQARKVRQVSELDENGQRRYRKQITTTLRDKEEWVAIPVPAYLPRSLVHRARTMMAAHRCPERKHLARNWELRGLVRCRCGVLMRTHTSKSGEKLYHYYKCCCRSDYKRGTCRQKCLRAEAVEETVWSFVSSLLQDPEKIRTGMNALIEQERSADSRNVDKELVVWAKKVEECVHLRSAYQNQQASGLMTLEELGANLTERDNMRKTAEQELVALKNRREGVEELEKDRDILLKSMADRVPRALYDLTGEEKHKLYQMLRIEVAPCEEGYAVNGAFCTWEPIREYTDRP